MIYGNKFLNESLTIQVLEFDFGTIDALLKECDLSVLTEENKGSVSGGIRDRIIALIDKVVSKIKELINDAKRVFNNFKDVATSGAIDAKIKLLYKDIDKLPSNISDMEAKIYLVNDNYFKFQDKLKESISICTKVSDTYAHKIWFFFVDTLTKDVDKARSAIDDVKSTLNNNIIPVDRNDILTEFFEEKEYKFNSKNDLIEFVSNASKCKESVEKSNKIFNDAIVDLAKLKTEIAKISNENFKEKQTNNDFKDLVNIIKENITGVTTALKAYSIILSSAFKGLTICEKILKNKPTTTEE